MLGGAVRKACRCIAVIAVTAVAGGLITATMVRFGPGFSADEKLLDTRLSEDSLAAIRSQHDSERSLPRFYAGHLKRLLRGDFGVSQSMQRPVGELMAARLPVTLKLIGWGMAGGWLLGLALGIAVVRWRQPLWSGLATAIGGLLLSLPAAALALLMFYCGGPIYCVLALALAPKIFQYARNVLSQAQRSQHVLAAHARGLGANRVFARHVLPIALPQLAALAGVSVSMALSAAIPIEVICDLPGVGQLAWKAAVARDLPLLVNLTFVIVVFTQCGNLISDCATAAWGRRTA